MVRSREREEIEKRAFEIYMEQGCPEGKALEHWLTAEQELADLDYASETEKLNSDAPQKSFTAGHGSF
jgi:hypothetical protein